MGYPIEVKEAAQRLYLKHYEVPEIAEQLNIPKRTLYHWVKQEKWDAMLSHESAETSIFRRLQVLAERDNKSDRELNEMDRLTGVLHDLQKLKERQLAAAVQVKAGPPVEGGESPGGDNQGKKKRKKPKRNQVSHLTQADFDREFRGKLYQYQRNWLEAKENPLTRRIRFILKSRQIGATFYFAGEAFEDACLTGDNQIFLSASRAQAEIFRAYIVGFAREWFGIELAGNPIILDNGAELHFLSTNSSTSQGYHGHVYVDECFWIRDFEKLNQVAGAIATHKKWRKTYFSTPSAKSHQAYPMWSMDKFNERRRRRNQAEAILPTEKELRAGIKCEDRTWRNIVTIDDAVSGGCDLFDIEELKDEYSEEEFKQLFRCCFIDDHASIFKLKELQQCLADVTDFKGFDPKAKRPYGSLPVWIGYDPSRTTDNATCVVIAPPLEPGGKFKVLEKHSWRGVNFRFQAQQIKRLLERYNVQYIGIDTTGIGYGVFELVQEFYPRAKAIHYSIDSKTELVMKAVEVVGGGRIEWDASWSDIATGFMTIRQTTTRGGQLTYAAGRTEKSGHADAAWSIMHALINEPLNHDHRRKSTWSVDDD